MITSRYISNNTFQHGVVIANIGVDTAADGLPKGLKKRAAGSAGPLASFLEEALQLLGLLLRRPGALLHGPPELRSIGELFDLNDSKNILLIKKTNYHIVIIIKTLVLNIFILKS